MPFSVGSSPRVRGKPRSSGIVSHASRLIPACAGKTHLPGLSRSASTAHPRACGENENVAGHDDAFQGSSPRVRGKQRVSCCVPSSCGLIPARAGKTPHGVGVGVERRAHPRACGENAPAGRPSRGTSGSSPRGRGKLAEHVEGGLLDGLIPACAGKTGASRRCGSRARAHPRVCGENYGVEIELFDGYGSSPRVRGKLCVWVPLQLMRGLIPACAGKTRQRRGRRMGHPAHPRVCGENR